MRETIIAVRKQSVKAWLYDGGDIDKDTAPDWVMQFKNKFFNKNHGMWQICVNRLKNEYVPLNAGDYILLDDDENRLVKISGKDFKNKYDITETQSE